MGKVGIKTYLGKLNVCHQTIQGHNYSILSLPPPPSLSLSLTHAHTRTHTHSLFLSEASRLLPDLHLGVYPNSAVVVPEEFPRGRFG